jgi:hypothetical protein
MIKIRLWVKEVMIGAKTASSPGDNAGFCWIGGLTMLPIWIWNFQSQTDPDPVTDPNLRVIIDIEDPPS